MSLFEIKNVSKSFGDLKVLNDITVSVDKGEVVAIIGPSGSGKSTLLRCATMLETMDSGELIYHGEKAASNDAEGKAADKMQCAQETTAGRIMLYEFLPHDGKMTFDYLNTQWSIGFLGQIVKNVYAVYGPKVTVIFCDKIMKMGFKYATLSGISLSKEDIKVPADKYEKIEEVMEKIKEIDKQYQEGYITTKERFNKVTDYWAERGF